MSGRTPPGVSNLSSRSRLGTLPDQRVFSEGSVDGLVSLEFFEDYGLPSEEESRVSSSLEGGAGGFHPESAISERVAGAVGGNVGSNEEDSAPHVVHELLLHPRRAQQASAEEFEFEEVFDFPRSSGTLRPTGMGDLSSTSLGGSFTEAEVYSEDSLTGNPPSLTPPVSKSDASSFESGPSVMPIIRSPSSPDISGHKFAPAPAAHSSTDSRENISAAEDIEAAQQNENHTMLKSSKHAVSTDSPGARVRLGDRNDSISTASLEIPTDPALGGGNVEPPVHEGQNDTIDSDMGRMLEDGVKIEMQNSIPGRFGGIIFVKAVFLVIPFFFGVYDSMKHLELWLRLDWDVWRSIAWGFVYNATTLVPYGVYRWWIDPLIWHDLPDAPLAHLLADLLFMAVWTVPVVILSIILSTIKGNEVARQMGLLLSNSGRPGSVRRRAAAMAPLDDLARLPDEISEAMMYRLALTSFSAMSVVFELLPSIGWMVALFCAAWIYGYTCFDIAKCQTYSLRVRLYTLVLNFQYCIGFGMPIALLCLGRDFFVANAVVSAVTPIVSTLFNFIS